MARRERFRADLDLEFPIYRQTILGHFWGTASGAEVHRFYGFGNETAATDEREAYRAFSRQISGRRDPPLFGFPPGSPSRPGRPIPL